MKKTILAFLAFSTILISCKKDKSAPAAPVVKYMSLSASSTWYYEVTDNIDDDSTSYTIKSTNSDSTIGTKAYHVFTNTSGANQYYNITGSDYYTFQHLPDALGGGSVENIYLKDNAAVNSPWSQSYSITSSGIPVTVIIINTITEKGLTKTISGVEYKNVIHVTTNLSISVLGTPLPAGAVVTDIQSYYAEKVGMIQSKNKISIDYSGITDNVDQDTYLKTADIK